MEIGLLNLVLYVVVLILMVYWGWCLDCFGECCWYMVVLMLLIGVGLFVMLLSGLLLFMICMFCVVLVGVYLFKGLFWVFVIDMLFNSIVVVGFVMVNVIVNLFGGGLMVNVYGWVKVVMGSYVFVLMLFVIFMFVSVVMLLLFMCNYVVGKLVGKMGII